MTFTTTNGNTVTFKKPQTLYSLTACENLMDRYYEAGGECITVEEGTLGLGTVICFGKGLKTAIITEVYLNEWSSGHKIRMYNKMPKKYEEMLDKWYEEN